MGSSNLHGSSGPGGMDGTSRGKTETAEYSILGVLYTLSKEKKRMSLRFAAMTILIDFLRTCAVPRARCPPFPGRNLPESGATTLPPRPELGAFCITLPYINHYFEWVELRGLFASAGWSMYQTVFWFWSAVLVFCIAICLYVCYCFRRDTFPYLWPIKILRNILGLFFSIFYVTSLNFFLISLDCEDKGGRQTLAVFSDQPCWEGKLLAMQVVAVILGICFFCISLLLAIASASATPAPRPTPSPHLTDPVPRCRVRHRRFAAWPPRGHGQHRRDPHVLHAQPHHPGGCPPSWAVPNRS